MAGFAYPILRSCAAGNTLIGQTLSALDPKSAFCQVFYVPLDCVQWRNELMRHILQVLNALAFHLRQLLFQVGAARFEFLDAHSIIWLRRQTRALRHWQAPSESAPLPHLSRMRYQCKL